MLVNVQTRNVLAVIDPATLTITRRLPLPGCNHNHGLALDPSRRLAFVACDGNATLLTIDLNSWEVLDARRVGDDPDVLAYDPTAGRLYVAAESGWLTTLDQRDRRSPLPAAPISPIAHTSSPSTPPSTVATTRSRMERPVNPPCCASTRRAECLLARGTTVAESGHSR